MTLSWENVQNEERRGSTAALKYSIPGQTEEEGPSGETEKGWMEKTEKIQKSVLT